MFKIKIKISIFGMILILFLLFGDNAVYSVIALSAAAFHELGHIAAAFFLGVKLNGMSFGIMGARLGIAMPLYSYRRELILCLAGPLFNLIGGGISFLIYSMTSNSYILFYAVASVFLALLNLCPIKSFDGGRIFNCIAEPLLGVYLAEKILSVLSFAFILLLWIVSVYLMIRVGSSIALFVFSAAVFAEIFLNG